MSTHDYNLANQVGSDARADLNLLFQAIVSQNSSATEPATMYAYMFWRDTTAGYLKQRNSTNTAWVGLSIAPATLAVHAVAGSQLFGFRNKLRNGAFRVYQRGAGNVLSGTPTCAVDGWISAIDAGTVTQNQGTSFNNGNCLALTCTGAGMTYGWSRQHIESTNLQDLIGGKLTYSLWLYSTTAFTFSIVLYPLTTLNGLTAGAAISGAAKSCMHTGGSTWQQFSFTCTNNIVSADVINGLIFSVEYSGGLANGQTVAVSYVQLEPGSLVTPIEIPPIEIETARCQRYYEKGQTRFDTYATYTAPYSERVDYKVAKRLAPNVTITNVSNTNFPVTFTVTANDANGHYEYRIANGTGNAGFASTWVAEKELGLS